MRTSKQIGQVVLIKYSILNTLSLFIIVLIFMIYSLRNDNVFTEIHSSVKYIMHIVLNNSNRIIIKSIVIIPIIWPFGGWVGRVIIDKGYPSGVIGLFSFVILWMILFLVSMIYAAMLNYIDWGLQGIGPAILGSLMYGLFPFALLGIISGFVFGILFGKEVEKRGKSTITKA